MTDGSAVGQMEDQESIFIRAEAALKLHLEPATVVMVQTFARSSFGELTSLEATYRNF